ncbi:asparaginase [Zymobacter palmae]|uniref:L-asparaginase/archaeal Glu-tRNAGln n=1 Tax=Zymobacter palmae TaxID=33074 RepID=A0A348HIK7_9GAMM|nr:asparaginase [Zymobacter palmae]BBG31459.1 L-asparaginase/archaeal Glu-tRNAGln [Zymobacter palmae]
MSLSRSARLLLSCCFTLFISLSWLTAEAATPPHIVILATGGTIAGQGASSEQTTGYKAGVVGVDQLIQAVPELKHVANVSGEQVFNMASEDMSTSQIAALSARVNALLARSDVDGVVITHGTDTIEETAYYLDLTVNSEKPVVMTASMRPSTAISADGPMNLLEAVRVAANPNAGGRGVMVVLNDRIGAARFVTKSNTTALDTFKAPEEGYMGRIVGPDVVFDYHPDRLHTTHSAFAGMTSSKQPNVIILSGYQDDPGFLFDAAIAQHVDGIVFAGPGAGSVSSRSREGMQRAIAKGITIVRTSRTGSGNTPTDPQLPGVVADSLNAPKARILLLLALQKTHDTHQLQTWFHTH